jgi:hypothetical protein
MAMTRAEKWHIPTGATHRTFVGDLVIRVDGIAVVIGPVSGNTTRACGLWDERESLSTEFISAYGPQRALKGIVR